MTGAAQAETRPISVRHGGAELEAMLVHAPGAAPRPAVLIFPTIMGRSELEIGFVLGMGEAPAQAAHAGADDVEEPFCVRVVPLVGT